MVAMVQIPPRSAYASMSKDELIDALEAHDQTLQSIYQIIHLENARMAPGEKLFWIGARNILAQEKPNEEGLVRLPTDKVAKFIGMSESSTGRYANNVIDRYTATKVPVPYTTLKGQDRTLTYVNRDEPVWLEPWNVDLPEEKERVINGNGKYCPSCRTNNLRVTTRRLTYQEVQECDCCNYRKVSRILNDPDNEPLDPMEYWPTPKGPQAGEPFESDEKALTSAPAYDPCTTPALHIVPDQESEKVSSLESLFSPEELERQACQLLLEIAGPHTRHIEMSRNAKADKYFTVHSALTQDDMLSHLHGSATKGVFNRSLDGETRAINKDADTPEEWARIQDAARLLKTVDFKPILIPSPVQNGKHRGGGHFWIVFDHAVDAYSAQQTIYQYTGNLLTDIKDGWPGGNINMRLPGGKYVHTCEAWCDLYDADGNQLTHDGDGTARALLGSQTRADLVIAYEKPAPSLVPSRPARGGEYLEKDVMDAVITEFNDSHSWEQLLGQSNRRGKYPAVWREDRNPNVGVNPRTDLAKDFSTEAWLTTSMDKYQVWCLIEGRHGWEEFKRRDLAERCNEWRSRNSSQEQVREEVVGEEESPSTFFETQLKPEVRPLYDAYGLPTRMTICCNVPFQIGARGTPECSNPECPERQVLA